MYAYYDTKSEIFSNGVQAGFLDKMGCYLRQESNQENNHGGANGVPNQATPMHGCDENQRMYATLLQN